jgi:hypothetical protein
VKKQQLRKVSFYGKPAKGGGFEGHVLIPWPGGAVAKVSLTGRNRQEAVAKAATLAKAAMENPLVQSILPPGTMLAVDTLQRLAKSPTGKMLKKIGGPAKKRVVKALRSIF